MSNKTDFEALAIKAGNVFQPSGPIEVRDLFAGRREQLQQILDAVNTSGQHAILYGERGVGKTSLANMLAPFLYAIEAQGVLVCQRVVCTTADTFASAWRKLFDDVNIGADVAAFGFSPDSRRETRSLSEAVHLASDPTPDDVRRVVNQLQRSVFIFDEFDRLRDDAVTTFADLLKMLSDYNISATVVLVGVAGSTTDLIREHESVSRCLVQIAMPRMSRDELNEILQRASKSLGMRFEPAAAERVVNLSQGLPHFTHLLGLYGARSALAERRLTVTDDDIERAVGNAIVKTSADIQAKYHAAIHSTHPDALYEQVLIACALAEKDDLGYFQAAKVVEPLAQILGRHVTHATFSRHLTEFCAADRGPVLESQGGAHRRRYRFVNTMMPPYAILGGTKAHNVPPTSVNLD